MINGLTRCKYAIDFFILMYTSIDPYPAPRVTQQHITAIVSACSDNTTRSVRVGCNATDSVVQDVYRYAR